MDALKKYLDTRLQIFKESCDNWLANLKQGLHSQHNQFLIEKIQEAENTIEKGKSQYVQMFEESMANLEKEKEGAPASMKTFFQLSEDNIKKQLESNLAFVDKSARDFIENCKAQMK